MAPLPAASFRLARKLIATLAVVACIGLFPQTSTAQLLPGGIGGAAPGVVVQPDGTVTRKELDAKGELDIMRARAKAAVDAGKAEKAGFVSLPRALAAARAATDAGKPVPDEIKYLGGLTRIDYVLLYPESHDLVIAGPAEPVHVVDEITAVGVKTGRPVLRLEDFVVSMRVVSGLRGGAFGCRIDPDPASPARIQDVMLKMARSTRAERVKAVAAAAGPQKVSFFGNVPDDTRFAFATVAADYELKRYGLGLARSTVADLGSAVDNTRAAVSMIWFELDYEPILVSPAGDAFGLRGQRLKVQAGNFSWDPKGATPKAYEFASKMTKHMPTLAATQPLIADLQNLADLAVVSALIQKEGLDRKVGWDTSALVAGRPGRGQGQNDSAVDARGVDGFPIARVTVPKTTAPIANYTNGSIATGGVVLTPSAIVSRPAQKDTTGAAETAVKKGAELRKEKPDAAVVVQP